MFNRYLTYYSPAFQFVVFCAIMSMSFIVGVYIAELLNEKYLGVSSTALESMTHISPALAFKLKILNPILLTIILLLPALLFAYLAFPKPAKYLGLSATAHPTFFVMSILLLLVSLPFVSALEQWSQMMMPFIVNKETDSYDVLTKAMLKGSSINDLIINSISICMIPAFVEEVFFRGCLQQILLKWLRNYQVVAIIIVAVLFSAFHGQISGFLPRVYLGLLLGLVYYFSGNLWITILMHFTNNFISVFFTFLKERDSITFDIMDTTSVPVFVALISLLLTAGVVYWLYGKRIAFLPIEVVQGDDTSDDIHFK